MKVIRQLLLLALLLFSMALLHAQSINSENVEIQLLQAPKVTVEPDFRNYKVTVTSPYNLTADDITKQAKADHQKALADYGKTVTESEKEYQQKLKDHDEAVKKAKEKYDLEMTEFKKLTLIERLSMTDQGKNPKLTIPVKPEYYKPAAPVYREPNLNDYIIVDNAVLASQVNIEGLKKGGDFFDISIDMQAVHFQDNAGQTYANQPVKIKVKQAGVEKATYSFFNDYEFVSSSPSNNINKPLEEKRYLNKVIAFINQYLTDNYGYRTIKKTVKILSVKNKGAYDDLERADIYITTNLKKLQADADTTVNVMAFTNMQKGIDIWNQTLQKIDYKDSKADLNHKIAKFIFFNLMRVNLALNKKAEAEKYLNQLQENLVYIKLSSDEEKELDTIEKEIYKKK